jgi:hypothetical protein
METKKELLEKTGYVDENHLKELVQEPDYTGGAWTTLPCVGAIIVATLNFNACPTSACTKSCNR